ncbi:hypothetical protein [Pseudoalteromonas aurantia]|uniref:Uncharacterized protein n=1 Tax=Pseudoalteromonas aurantia 208 TaxID=1314867 RepID=A0ABR9EDI0_9GAMM|nr:hypothetical protein [Pseudoalteromonas aurantia]MBE0368419.1 hypothetical protein [Pseudoalteromonas aurantia 208]
MNTLQNFKSQHEQSSALYIGNVCKAPRAAAPSVMHPEGTL